MMDLSSSEKKCWKHFHDVLRDTNDLDSIMSLCNTFSSSDTIDLRCVSETASMLAALRNDTAGLEMKSAMEDSENQTTECTGKSSEPINIIPRSEGFIPVWNSSSSSSGSSAYDANSQNPWDRGPGEMCKHHHFTTVESEESTPDQSWYCTETAANLLQSLCPSTKQPESAVQCDDNPSSASTAASSGRRKASQRARTIMLDWLVAHESHPYPSLTEKEGLASETGLTLHQVTNWMSNVRKRRLVPLVVKDKEAKSKADRTFVEYIKKRKLTDTNANEAQ